MALSHPTVNYVATLPGMQGVIVAFIAEFVIAFVLMSVVLRVSNTPHIARYTGLFAGALVATYITLGIAAFGHEHESGAHIRLRICRSYLDWALDLLHRACAGDAIGSDCFISADKGTVYCAKYHHYNRHRCIFNCRFPELLERERAVNAMLLRP